jgi:hypothetical protein
VKSVVKIDERFVYEKYDDGTWRKWKAAQVDDDKPPKPPKYKRIRKFKKRG